MKRHISVLNFQILLVISQLCISTVLCEYSKTTNRVNCDEPFKFCSNKRPNNEPQSCQRNGGYPGKLNLDTSTNSDYSQYRGASALKPCFNNEIKDLGFEDDQGIETIDVFTENNFNIQPNVEYGNWKVVSGGYGSYGKRPKRQSLQNNNLGSGGGENRNAISIVFEEPGSRMALIEYLK